MSGSDLHGSELRGRRVEGDQPVAIVDVDSQRLQDVKAKHAGHLHSGILLDGRRIPLEYAVAVIQGKVGKLETEGVAVYLELSARHGGDGIGEVKPRAGNGVRDLWSHGAETDPAVQNKEPALFLVNHNGNEQILALVVDRRVAMHVWCCVAIPRQSVLLAVGPFRQRRELEFFMGEVEANEVGCEYIAADEPVDAPGEGAIAYPYHAIAKLERSYMNAI